jgi:hypothetical protein
LREQGRSPGARTARRRPSARRACARQAQQVDLQRVDVERQEAAACTASTWKGPCAAGRWRRSPGSAGSSRPRCWRT